MPSRPKDEALAAPVEAEGGGRAAAAVPGILIGAGLGGFVDGIMLHQLLQWHHMLTDHGRFDRYPPATVTDLESNTRWDGAFHAATWLFVVVGLFLLVRGLRANRAALSLRDLSALLLIGWGAFNVVEGLVNHHILTLHHVRDDVSDPLPWDLAFLGLGAVLIATGLALRRSVTTYRPR